MPSTRLELSRMFGLRRGPQVRRYDLHHSPVTIMFVRLCLHPDGGLKRRRGRRQGVGWNENLREESEGRTTHVRGPPTDPVDHQFEDLHWSSRQRHDVVTPVFLSIRSLYQYQGDQGLRSSSHFTPCTSDPTLSTNSSSEMSIFSTTPVC